MRNAIAHNNVIFDTRFKERNIKKSLAKAIENDIGIQNLNFRSITDYLIFVGYILKKLDKSNKEIIKIINDYIKYTNNLKEIIDTSIYDQIIFTDDDQKLKDFIKFLKKK